jgi:hypothetical protein
MSGSGLRVNLKKTEIVIFQCDRQIDKTICEMRKTVQALRTVQRYFSKDELLKLCTALCFSKLYYDSEVWLIPNLKESLLKKLYSQSVKCLEVVDLTKSYWELHANYHRAFFIVSDIIILLLRSK